MAFLDSLALTIFGLGIQPGHVGRSENKFYQHLYFTTFISGYNSVIVFSNRLQYCADWMLVSLIFTLGEMNGNRIVYEVAEPQKKYIISISQSFNSELVSI